MHAREDGDRLSIQRSDRNFKILCALVPRLTTTTEAPFGLAVMQPARSPKFASSQYAEENRKNLKEPSGSKAPAVSETATQAPKAH